MFFFIVLAPGVEGDSCGYDVAESHHQKDTGKPGFTNNTDFQWTFDNLPTERLHSHTVYLYL